MFGKQITRRLTTFILALAIICTHTMIMFANPKVMTGGITVNGQVFVNGQAEVSDSTLVSGSTIVTRPNSSATITLGRNGRVEILENSSLNLKFTENTITGVLSTGDIRVANTVGVQSVFNTTNSTIVSDSAQVNTFSIVIDCSNAEKCSDTFVETEEGLVTLKNGSTDRQIAAGMDSSEGNSADPAALPARRRIKKRGGILLAIAIATGVALAIYFGTRDDDTVISPTN